MDRINYVSLYFWQLLIDVKMNYAYKFLLVFLTGLLLGCAEEGTDQPIDDCITNNFFGEYSSRNFGMGFSTWPYAPTEQSVNDTYQFIGDNSDVYSEHIDSNIPWDSWINDLPLPIEFTNEIGGRVSRKMSNIKLALSVSLLNTDRSDLAKDFDGSTPNYASLNDKEIEDAYFMHIQYLTDRFDPEYLIIAIEVNELKIKSPSKWDEYKLLIQNVKTRILQQFPSLKISESITLHNLYQPDVPNPEAYVEEIINYANEMEFVAISFYPFFKGLHSKADFQLAFDFLHNKITKPIAFSETSHLGEDLSINGFNLEIEGSECEQNLYLESLLKNAQENNYEYITWWAHRDFHELWLTFPAEMKDLGKVWRNTGIIKDDGSKRKAYSIWNLVYNK